MATAILQARMGSTRLPGKVLMKILGKPMIWFSIESLKHSQGVNRIVLAIPDNHKNNPLVEVANICDIELYRGSEQNVLQRFYNAAIQFKDEFYVRATGDNPILDTQNPIRTLKHLKKKNLDYVMETGMPIGTIVEGFTFNALERAFQLGTTPEEIEHVTWIMKNNNAFKTARIKAPEEYYSPHLRLTVDYPEDFQRVCNIISHLYKEKIPDFIEILNYSKNSIG